jgi:hypothetical protein
MSSKICVIFKNVILCSILNSLAERPIQGRKNLVHTLTSSFLKIGLSINHPSEF